MLNKIPEHLKNQVESNGDFFWLRSRHKLITNYIRRSNISNVLDIGAGSGGLGDEIKSSEANVQYFFEEIDTSSVTYLEEKFGTSANIKKIEKKEYDCLVLMDVIEHIEKPDEFLEEKLKFLKEDGLLIISVPAYMFLWSNWDVLLGHYRRYTKKSLRELLDKYNLENKECSYIFPELFFAGVIRKMLNINSPEFPTIPVFINTFLYWVTYILIKLRRITPFGLSVISISKKSAA